MILEFITANWYLFAMLAVIVLLLAINPGTRGVGGARKIPPMELPRLQSREAAVVVDVGAPQIFQQGHIEGAINLPLENLESKLAKLNKHKQKPLIIACQNGALSGKAAAILRRHDFTKLYVLEGGLAAWRKDNLPLVKK